MAVRLVRTGNSFVRLGKTVTGSMEATMQIRNLGAGAGSTHRCKAIRYQ